MTKSHISRRTLLKGMGGVTVGLPLLEEMLCRVRWSPVCRQMCPHVPSIVFFGLGYSRSAATPRALMVYSNRSSRSSKKAADHAQRRINCVATRRQ